MTSFLKKSASKAGSRNADEPRTSEEELTKTYQAITQATKETRSHGPLADRVDYSTDNLNGPLASVDDSSESNLWKLMTTAKHLLDEPISERDFQTEELTPIHRQVTNQEALTRLKSMDVTKFAGWLLDERKGHQVSAPPPAPVELTPPPVEVETPSPPPEATDPRPAKKEMPAPKKESKTEEAKLEAKPDAKAETKATTKAD